MFMASEAGIKGCLLQSVSPNNFKLFGLTYENHYGYVQKHGYDFLVYNEPYTPYIVTDRVRTLLHTYDVVITIGCDLLIQHPELSLVYPHTVTMCRELGHGCLNGDLIIYRSLPETFKNLDTLDEYQYKFKDGQQALNRCFSVHEEPMLQIAAPIMNPHKDYTGVNIEDYFAMHFHALGKLPDVTDKSTAIENFLKISQKHP